MNYEVNLIRNLKIRVRREKIADQINWLVSRALSSNRGRGWVVLSDNIQGPIENKEGYSFVVSLSLKKIKGQLNGSVEYNQWQNIKAMFERCVNSTKFVNNPWKVRFSDQDTEIESPDFFEKKENTIEDLIPAVPTFVESSEKEFDWQDYNFPDEILYDENALSEHSAFSDLYDIGPQIRTVLSAIKRAVETNGKSRYHSVLYGEPGCGKTSTLRAVEKLFGQGSVLHLDATSTTKAGIEKLFFSELKQYPKLVFLEEAEKASEEGLKIWLGALDDRGELRKINFRQTQIRQIEILFFCTANNKRAFDNMMGTGSGEPGALSSRCVNEIQFPRPTEATLRKILEKEIKTKGGNIDWVAPCLSLADELDVSDPRKVKAFLTGGDRLLDGSFQKDQKLIRGILM
jgi:hypothetical protein